MTKLPRLAVGDRLILRHLQRPTYQQEVVVTRIGRKWGYAAPEGSTFETKFDLATGYGDSGGYAARERLLTSGMAAEEGRRRKALEALNSHGIRFDHGVVERKFSTDTLEAVVDILNGAEATA